MKYILITADTCKYKKGDRIVVAVDDDYFLATVTGIKSGKILLDFDDGDSGKVLVGSKRILGFAINKHVKKAMSKIEAEKYLASPKQDKKKQNPKVKELIQVHDQLKRLFPTKDMDFTVEEENENDCGGIFNIVGIKEIDDLEDYLKKEFKLTRKEPYKRQVARLWISNKGNVGMWTREDLNTRKNRDKNTKMEVSFFLID